MNESQLPSSPRHLTLFVWLGVFATIVAFLVPLFLTQYVRSERARLAACERQERVDCDPSVIWLLMN